MNLAQPCSGEIVSEDNPGDRSIVIGDKSAQEAEYEPNQLRMNRQTLHQQLHNRLENLVERHFELMQQEPSIPQQEMNDLLRELRISYELALTLHHHNALKSMEDLEVMVAERYTDTPSSPEKQPEPVSAKAARPVAENMEELTVDAINLAEERKRAVVSPASDVNHLFEAPSTVAGQFREAATLAGTIAGQSGTSRIAESMKHQPIRDLRTAIGINERFIFTQFLFGNNAEQFSRTLDHLNNFSSWEEAKGYLDAEVVPKYGWNSSLNTVRTFVELVARRYSA